MNKKDLEYIFPIPEDKYNDVIQHLRFNFFADEPLNKCVGLCEPGCGHSELELHSILTLQDNLSVMAVDANGQVVGVALNGVQHEGDVDEAMKKLETINDKKFKQIFSMLYDLNQSLDFFKRYDVTSIFECRILSVDNHFRGRGMANEMFKLSIDVATKAGFKVFKVDATGVFSQKISEKLGLETLLELEYRHHLDSATGLPMFTPPAPHTSLKVMVKILH
uniref:aralkylamine N-acetyltransferase n=1 Tax=Cacopsylla melanoneura TaxID=428564 RepID=A0A8D8U9D0_9HEMI